MSAIALEIALSLYKLRTGARVITFTSLAKVSK